MFYFYFYISLHRILFWSLCMCAFWHTRPLSSNS